VNSYKFKKNSLFIENVPIKKLINKFSTPFYCYSANKIIENYKNFEKHFKYLEPIICYAVKANPNIAILKILAKFGAGAEVVSEGELKRSLKANINPKKIIFSGVGKTYKELEFAIKKNILQINVESLEEINLIEKISKKLKKIVQIGIRINPNIDAKTHKKITTGREENKFGIDIKNAEKIIKKYKNNNNIKLFGLSIHIGSQITSLMPYRKAFLIVKNLIKKINKKEKIIKYLDLGGGIGINYNNEKIINFKDYSKIITKIIKDIDCKLILEPGRIIVADTGILVSKVLYIKENKKNTFVIIDAGMNDFMRPALYNAKHNVQCINKKNGPKKLYTIVGPICETADTFNKKKLNKINNNDFLFINNVGAYGSSMSSSYNSRPIIMELIVNNNNFSIIRKKDIVESQISKEKIPSWINKIK
tara:strand:- start:2140 stop:3402 length:1263 start_codon:yes stop_codon:yes gene_type:complete